MNHENRSHTNFNLWATCALGVLLHYFDFGSTWDLGVPYTELPPIFHYRQYVPHFKGNCVTNSGHGSISILGQHGTQASHTRSYRQFLTMGNMYLISKVIVSRTQSTSLFRFWNHMRLRRPIYGVTANFSLWPICTSF